MTGITKLSELLNSMSPQRVDGAYVFVTLPEEAATAFKAKAVLVFKEEEGCTLILREEEAKGLDYSDTWAFITLTVHSDLQAVGFLAAITERLAAAGISVNAVSAYYHDHLFVSSEKAEQAMEILNSFNLKKAP